MSDGLDYARVRRELEVQRDMDGAARAARRAELEAAGDGELAREVASLLEHAERPDTALDAGALAGARELIDHSVEAVDSIAESPAGAGLPERIGRYRIVRRIGRGGMGEVFVAEQDQPRRTVALKVLRPDAVTPQLLKRFRQEAEILGRLQHPGIAQIHDAGTVATDGALERPYFAMELVNGRPITDHAVAHELDTRARMQLLARVCEAVHHAHTKGVIHRDIKPDNVFVVEGDEDSSSAGTRSDAAGRPKVLDFGIARATDADVQLTTIRTDVGQLVGTVPYMSPEQFTGDPSTVDVRTDVYALGVLMFELLTGRLPHEVRGVPIADAALRIREEDPATLSSVDTRLRGDLDTICAKALEKEPGRRYGSAAELADDLGRWLANEPIAARPASALYQLGRFCRRNRLLVGSAGIIATLLVVAVVGLSIAFVRALDAEETATVRYEESEAIAEFYAGVLQTVRSIGSGPDVRVVDMMHHMAERLDSGEDERLERFPVVRARIEHALAANFRDLGHYPEAVRFFRSAYATRLEHLGSDDAATVDSAFELGMSLNLPGVEHEAIALLMEVLPLIEASEGELAYRTVSVYQAIANAYDNDPRTVPEALEYYTEAMRRLEAGEGFASELASTVLTNSGLVLSRHGDADEAERRFLLAIEAGEDTDAIPLHRTMSTEAHLGMLYLDAGRLDEAEEHLRRSYDWTLENLGPNHIATAMGADKLACLHMSKGEYEPAEELLRFGIDRLNELVGPGHRYALRLNEHLSDALTADHREAAGLEAADHGLELAVGSYGEMSYWAATFHRCRYRALFALGRTEESDAALARSVEIVETLNAGG